MVIGLSKSLEDFMIELLSISDVTGLVLVLVTWFAVIINEIRL